MSRHDRRSRHAAAPAPGAPDPNALGTASEPAHLAQRLVADP